MRILFVSGFSSNTRARELAYEFERFGPLVRCDVPAPRHPHSRAVPYAFVEFRDGRDAENAYHDMHDRNFDGHRLSVQWARKPPSAAWRVGDGSAPPSRSDRDSRDSRARSRSPRRRSPERRRDREAEPRRRHSSGGRERDGAKTPPPLYATPMAVVDEHHTDRNDREYRDSVRDLAGSSKDLRDSGERRDSSRHRGDRNRDYDGREASYRREDAGEPLSRDG